MFLLPSIYYSDGSIKNINNPVGENARGVIAILQEHTEVGIEVVTSSDYYVKRNDGSWQGVDQFGLYDYLLKSGLVIFGEMVTREEYQKIMQKVAEDKKTWLPGEKKFK